MENWHQVFHQTRIIVRMNSTSAIFMMIMVFQGLEAIFLLIYNVGYHLLSILYLFLKCCIKMPS